MTDPPQDMTDPPQGTTDPPQEVTDPTQEESEAEQTALVADLIGATCSQQAEHAKQQTPYANQEVLDPTEVQQAKPKLMIPVFRRRTCALPVSTIHQGPNPLGHLVGSPGSPGSKGPTDLGPSSRDAAEDMEEEDPEKGNSMVTCQHCVILKNHIISGSLSVSWAGLFTV